MDSGIFDEILEEYEKQRSENKRKRDMRVRAAYEHVPELKRIEDEINRVGSGTLRTILSNPNDTGARDAMKEKFKILSQRKSELLRDNNIPEDFDKIHYKCSLCGDTGYIEGVGRCSCFKRRVAAALSLHSNMDEIMKKNNFDNFEERYYGTKRDERKKISPRENILAIKKTCENFIENFDKPQKSLVFLGDTGLGKTFMSGCVAKELIGRGKAVIYIRAADLFRKLDDERFGRSEGETEDLYKSDLLIIDDLGAEISTKYNASYLLNLISRRTENGKKMIINSNVSFEGIEKLYSKRITSRILEDFIVLYFYGKDIRRQKMMRRTN